MSVDVDYREAEADIVVRYRALSSAAVASLIVGVLSIAALLDPIMVAIPLIGIVLSVYAMRSCTRRSEELSGRRLAVVGLALSGFFVVAGPARLYHVYATELPPGYERITYADLQPDPDVIGQLIPPDIKKFDGQKIFIKGYPLPGQRQSGIKDFVLCRDQGQCCFGGNPALTDQVHVRLMDPLRLEYKLRLLKLAGTFHVRQPKPGEDPPRPYYYLEADHLE